MTPQIFVLFNLILEWSKARNIIGGGKAADQFVKLVSEFSNEISTAIYEIWTYHGSDTHQRKKLIVTSLKDAIGDSFVVLVNVSAQMGLDIKTIYGSQSFAVFTQVPHHGLLIAGMGQGRLADAIKKNNPDDAYAAIGLMIYGLQLICNEYGLRVEDCVEHAYLEIKDRKGVMYNGIFVKSDDANYERIVEELGLNSSTAAHGLHDHA
ncbi:NTP-pyrophosphyhydrolase [Pantoea phage Kyle]|uniref:NTP-pyrophosphyhydrolase n=1 Tax=Pantoea phage Kyle TaxID=2589665 RepID=A0A514A8R7_9CAUD|nr:MazG-like pyrophosphatase [Pantoea phage Kyle]QDH49671.1 NTP-pyrophosphyhydrolase [Pantoea phage Kyle]